MNKHVRKLMNNRRRLKKNHITRQIKKALVELAAYGFHRESNEVVARWLRSQGFHLFKHEKTPTSTVIWEIRFPK